MITFKYGLSVPVGTGKWPGRLGTEEAWLGRAGSSADPEPPGRTRIRAPFMQPGHHPGYGIICSMDLLADLEARGLVQDSTDRDALRARIQAGPVGVYYGCDPSNDSLQVGNLIGLLVLRKFADAGHNAIALAGGATGMIGDPGGKSKERNLLDTATLTRNTGRIAAQLERIAGVSLVNNLDWTESLPLLDFLRDVGKHASVNQMVLSLIHI